MKTHREIIFKAKRLDNGEWIDGYYMNVVPHRHEIVNYIPIEDPNAFTQYPIYRIDPTTLSQFTGLTDRNGIKIFENDIVEILAEDGYFYLHWEKDTARFIMENYSDRFSVDFDNYWSHEIEVCGNIFDNRELLGETE